MLKIPYKARQLDSYTDLLWDGGGGYKEGNIDIKVWIGVTIEIIQCRENRE